MKKAGTKVMAMMLALAMVFSVVPRMVATVEAGNEGWEEEITYLDVEIEIIDGQPMMVIEGEEEYGEEYLFIPLYLPETILATSDGQVVTLEVKGNSVLVPTEDGMVSVPIEDFCVVAIGGEMMLFVEVNAGFWAAVAFGIGVGVGATYVVRIIDAAWASLQRADTTPCPYRDITGP